MAVYRQLKAAFWESPFVMGLSPEERAFFVYMLLNPATTHSGVYKLSIQMMMAQCSYDEDTILQLIQKLVIWKKIAYDPQTHEFLVLSWMKHNRPKNPRTWDHIGKELRGIKSMGIQDLWNQTNPLDAEKLGLPYSIVTVEEQLGNSHVTVKNLENPENSTIQKDINSSVLGYSSVDLHKEVGCSLPGLKEEEPEHKDQGIQESGLDLYHRDPSLGEKKPEEVQKDQPEEESIPHLEGLNLKEANSQDQKGNQEPKKHPKPKRVRKQTGKSPHPGSAEPPPEEVIIRYMNRKFCTGYRLDSGNLLKLIRQKLNAGFTVKDFTVVIDKKFADWQAPRYRSNLVPHVLFGDKFEAYLQQSPREEKQGKSYSGRIPPSEFQNLTNEIVEVF